MMGIKERAFGPLPPVTLEELVPPDHFYRRLEDTPDLSFVRDLVRDAYVPSGLRAVGPTLHRSGRLLQTPAGDVLRGDPLRTQAHRDGESQLRAPLVSRVHAYQQAFGDAPTPHREAIRARLGWYAESPSSLDTPRRSHVADEVAMVRRSA